MEYVKTILPGLLLFIFGIILGLAVNHWFFVLSAIPLVLTAYENWRG